MRQSIMMNEQYQKEIIRHLKGLVWMLPDELPTEVDKRKWYLDTLRLAESQILKLKSELA